MKVERLPIALVMGLFVLLSVSYAATYYVHPDSVLNSIQTAIDGCVNGDTILVGPGTYVENINFKGMAIVVVSEYGPDTTIIDGSTPTHPDTGSVVIFMSGEDSTSMFHGFTVTNGSGTLHPGYPGHAGGGIWCYQSSPIITGNTISTNTAHYGGGIQCGVNSSPTIDSNTITGNISYESGGGITCYDYSSPTITHNIISDDSSYWGGGIMCHTSSSPTIAGNTITGNTATRGGGINCFSYSSPTIDSCVISYNNNDGVYCSGGSNPEIHYNDIINNFGYGVCNVASFVTVNADNNWWGDATGPYHPDSNPGGLGDSVSDYVDFTPWLTEPVGVKENEVIEVKRPESSVTIFSGLLLLPEGKNCRVFDITGRVVAPDRIRPGIYFIEVEGKITQKVIRIK